MSVHGYLKHTTKAGDRWDLLAWEYYGDAYAIELLLKVNPALSGLTSLPPGLTLVVPIVGPNEVKPEQKGDVPWR